MSSNCQTHFFGANEDKSKRGWGFPGGQRERKWITARQGELKGNPKGLH